MKYLLVGLGNVGHAYVRTRHNIGFMVLDHLAEQHSEAFSAGHLGFTAQVQYKGCCLWLLKPSTLVNGSGCAVHYWMGRLGVPTEKTLVITDDMALPFGKLRLRTKGSDGGHNGLKSIAKTLHTIAYPRLRVGIGHPGGWVNAYVLGNFTLDEQKKLPTTINLAAEAAFGFCRLGPGQAMSFYNKKQTEEHEKQAGRSHEGSLTLY